MKNRTGRWPGFACAGAEPITGLPHALILIAYPGEAAALLRLKQRPEQQRFAA
jgi:hypothetical protein